MANPKHLAILKEGVDAWNQWVVNQADLSGANSSKAYLHGANLREAWANRADLSGADLHGANLREADLHRADLHGADLGGADLGGANLSGANLREADLQLADLHGVDLGGTYLHGANLSKVALIWANLRQTDLSGADLHGADLRETDLFWADFHGADLRGANLTGADLFHANLTGADLHGVTIGSTVFADVDLSMVKGLNVVEFIGPSTIGIDTLYRSKGEIPESFLRAAGVPEAFIAFARSLVGNAIEFYSCFISHSSKDQEFAECLHADLRKKQLRVWYAPEDLKIGDCFQERIEQSIRLYDKVMIVLSEASIQSHWVEREVNAAREREERGNRSDILFPICIDEAVWNAPQPWVADIRRRLHVGDFRRWKDHDSYEKAFQRLLRDLAPEVEPGAGDQWNGKPG